MNLMQQIRAAAVPRGAVALWWVGQNGFLFKTHEGTVVGTDLYLTDSCVHIAPPGMNLGRQVPVQISPEEMDDDLFVCTHNHQDQTDP
jgi:L-ascorbate 6-phosphate lactonase